MDLIQTMRAFVAVADTAGFAPAARKLQMSPPAVTRAVAALEERLGAPLFHRTTRLVRLTDAGERFLEDCRRLLMELEEAEASVRGAFQAPRGRLAITASARFGYLYVAPLVSEFLDCHPEVSIEALFVDRVVNVLEEGIDVAVRIGDLPDSGLTAIRVGSVRRVICAAPAYLTARGIPQHPQDIAEHESILFSGLGGKPEWRFRSAGDELRVPVKSRLTVNTADVAIAAASAGRGLTQVLSYMIAKELKAGELQIVLADYEVPPWPIHVLYQEGRKASARIRAFVDFMVQRLRANDFLGGSRGSASEG